MTQIDATALSHSVPQDSSLSPDVMIVDFQLPDQNGLQLVEGLRRRGAEPPPAIMLSTYTNRSHSTIDAGFAAFLSKPWDAQDLAYCLEVALSHG